MAHIKKENRAQPMSNYIIYVIVSPLSDKRFFVNRTGVKRLYKTYSEHYNLRVTKTREFFAEAKKSNLLPPIFKLETIHTTERDCFRRCVAWTKFFISHGYEQITQDNLGNYAEDILPETEIYFNQIKDEQIDDVLFPIGGEFPNYGAQIKNSNTNTTISLRVDPDDYARIKSAAADSGMSMGSYCKQMSLNGKVINADLHFIESYVEMFDESKMLLRQILYSIHTTGKYYPADLKNIQLCIDALTEIQKQVNEDCINLIRALRE